MHQKRKENRTGRKFYEQTIWLLKLQELALKKVCFSNENPISLECKEQKLCWFFPRASLCLSEVHLYSKLHLLIASRNSWINCCMFCHFYNFVHCGKTEKSLCFLLLTSVSCSQPSHSNISAVMFLCSQLHGSHYNSRSSVCSHFSCI